MLKKYIKTARGNKIVALILTTLGAGAGLGIHPALFFTSSKPGKGACNA